MPDNPVGEVNVQSSTHNLDYYFDRSKEAMRHAIEHRKNGNIKMSESYIRSADLYLKLAIRRIRREEDL